MDKLIELEKKLKEYRELLDKASKEKHEDEKEDKELIAEAIDEHNEKKHGEPKDEDSAFKSEEIKINPNGQWSVGSKSVGEKPEHMKSMHGPVKTYDKNSKEVKEMNAKLQEQDNE